MQELRDKILSEGTVLSDHVLKADSFLNHQVDVALMERVGKEFARYFGGRGITKVLTAEASGITPAAFTALAMGVPMVFARKHLSLTLNEDLLTAEVESYTKGNTVNLVVSQKYVRPCERILIVDDFLAKGEVVRGLIRLAEQSGASIEGIGIVIEKSFQGGRGQIEQTGLPLYSLARIAALENGTVRFVSEEK